MLSAAKLRWKKRAKLLLESFEEEGKAWRMKFGQA